MKYAVTWRNNFEDKKAETSDFWYEMEDYLYALPFTNAKSKIDAARAFLIKEYGEIDFEITDWVNDTYEYMMEKFIRYSVCGESLLCQYEKQDKITKLISEIQEYYIECLMRDGQITIHINGENFSYTSPGDDDKYIEMVQEKFCSDRLISLLNEDEKKEAFVEANLSEIMVIPLKFFK